MSKSLRELLLQYTDSQGGLKILANYRLASLHSHLHITVKYQSYVCLNSPFLLWGMHSESGSLNLIIHEFFSNHDTFVSVLTCTGEEGEDTAIWPSDTCHSQMYHMCIFVNYEKLYMFPFSIHMVVILCLLFIEYSFLPSCKIQSQGNIYILNHNSWLMVILYAITGENITDDLLWSAHFCPWVWHPLTFQLSMNVKSIVLIKETETGQFINPL